jgi:hypothetical protein
VPAKNRTRAAVAAQVILLAYLQIIEWVNLYPWNDIRRGNGQETLDIVIGIVMLAAIIATWRRWRPGMFIALAAYVGWLVLQITTFWIPYARGASPRWARIHAANFAQTVQWLPNKGNHLPPDASHFVLQLLLVAAIVYTALAIRGRART